MQRTGQSVSLSTAPLWFVCTGQLKQDVPWPIHPAVVDLYLEPAGEVDVHYEDNDLLQPHLQLVLEPVAMAPPVTELVS